MNQFSVLVRTGAVSDNLSSSQIQQHTDLCPLGSYTNVCQITDYTGSRESVAELPVNQIGHWGFVHPGRMNSILLAHVSRYQAPLLHDPSDLPPGYDPALSQQFMLELSLALYTAILIISVLNNLFQIPLLRSASAFVVIGAACNAKAQTQR